MDPDLNSESHGKSILIGLGMVVGLGFIATLALWGLLSVLFAVAH